MNKPKARKRERALSNLQEGRGEGAVIERRAPRGDWPSAGRGSHCQYHRLRAIPLQDCPERKDLAAVGA